MFSQPQAPKKKLIHAAAAAGVQWVLPNEFGMYNTENAQNDTIGPDKTKSRQFIESLGLSWVGVTCGFWYEHSLSGLGLYSFDIAKREVIFFDEDGKAEYVDLVAGGPRSHSFVITSNSTHGWTRGVHHTEYVPEPHGLCGVFHIVIT